MGCGPNWRVSCSFVTFISRLRASVPRSSAASRSAIAHATSATEAAKAAKVLIGQYAFLKTHDPDAFNASIAAVLGQYPIGLVQECIDPRRGAARGGGVRCVSGRQRARRREEEEEEKWA